MSDCEEIGNELVDRHRKEKKEMRAKILAMKKAAKSGNKQKQKETNAECEKIEKEMEDRHKKEIAEQEELKPVEQEPVAENENPQQIENEENEEDAGFYKETKISGKAAKKQAKKKAADEKWKNAMKEDKAASKTSDKYFENEIITKILADKSMQMFEILPDGDCMYNSIAHQLTKIGNETNGKKLRQLCAEYMKNNKDDFLPFIADENFGGEESDWLKYLDGVRNSADSGGVWGGDLELNALSRCLKRVIQVYKTDGERKYGEEFDGENHIPIRIVYLRRAFQLGEHYNSTV